MEILNLLEQASELKRYFSPKVIGEVNDTFIKVAKIKGEDVPWHNHKNEDELFYIINGSLLFEEEGKEAFIMNKGDMYIVKQGVNHRVSSSNECLILLVENKSTLHTGEITTAITKSISDQLQ